MPTDKEIEAAAKGIFIARDYAFYRDWEAHKKRALGYIKKKEINNFTYVYYSCMSDATAALKAAKKVRVEATPNEEFFADSDKLPDLPPKRRPWGSRPRQG